MGVHLPGPTHFRTPQRGALRFRGSAHEFREFPRAPVALLSTHEVLRAGSVSSWEHARKRRDAGRRPYRRERRARHPVCSQRSRLALRWATTGERWEAIDRTPGPMWPPP